MLVTSCLLRKILTSLSPTFEVSSRWVMIYFFPILVVSACIYIHTGIINLSSVGLSPHHTNIRKGFLLSKFNGSTVGAAVDFAASIYCAWITTIEMLFKSAADSVLGVCDLVSYIDTGEWVSGTQNSHLCLAHSIMLGVCRMERNFMAVAEFFLL